MHVSRSGLRQARLREVARSQKPQKPEAREAKLRSAAFWDPAFSAPPLCVPLRSTAAAFRCVPGSCVPALCVLLRSGLFCVLGATALRSAAFQGCCVPLRSAFAAFCGSCVPAFCVPPLLRSPAFSVGCVLCVLRSPSSERSHSKHKRTLRQPCIHV